MIIYANMISLICLALIGLSEVSGSGTDGQDPVFYMYSYLPSGDKCGQQKPISGWTKGIERCDPNAANSGLTAPTGMTTTACASDQFDTGSGILTLPFRGGYQCCAQFRCKQGGYCDFTVIRNGGTVYQAFGTRNTGITSNGWSSHSACWITNAAAGTTFWINLESTAGTDCIEETGWRYSTLSCAYISART